MDNFIRDLKLPILLRNSPGKINSFNQNKIGVVKRWQRILISGPGFTIAQVC
jgi:hypothetical protein